MDKGLLKLTIIVKDQINLEKLGQYYGCWCCDTDYKLYRSFHVEGFKLIASFKWAEMV